MYMVVIWCYIYIYTNHFRITSDILEWQTLFLSQVELVSHWALRPKAQTGRDTYGGWRLAIFKGWIWRIWSVFKDLKDLERNSDLILIQLEGSHFLETTLKGSQDFYTSLFEIFPEILFKEVYPFSIAKPISLLEGLAMEKFHLSLVSLLSCKEALWRWALPVICH